MIRRPPRSTLDRSSAASDVYKRQVEEAVSVARDYVGDPVDFDDVDAVGELAVHARRIVRESRGSRLSLIHISEPTRPY